jgi:hypothetical protein
MASLGTESMFDITTCRDFHRKLKADSEDFAKEQDSGRLALNCIITAYHLHEWVWGDWLKTDYAAWKQLRIKDKDSFVAWIERECPAFTTVQDLANGAKHFIRKQEVETRRVAGYGMGPYGIGPFGGSYLLIDYGADAGDQRYKTAKDLIDAVADFWSAFFQRYLPEPDTEQAQTHSD